MEGLGAAASVIAVLDLSAKVASLFVQYSRAVKDAPNNIARLQSEIKSLKNILGDVKQLLNDPASVKLSASQKLLEALNDCFSLLKSLAKILEPGKTQKTISRLGVRALRWPFESNEGDRIIRELDRCKQTISLALEIDQTALILDISQKIDLEKLPIAEGAAFDSYREEHNARCHPDTRIELLRQINKWASDPQGKCIFGYFTDKGQLGASFFFKRGEGDRSGASKF